MGEHLFAHYFLCRFLMHLMMINCLPVKNFTILVTRRPALVKNIGILVRG